jgi:hypothetical protein
LELSQAKATASVERQVQSLNDSTTMIKAQQNGTEATAAAGIAYKNAIATGASDTAASALSAATLANYAAKAAASTQQMAAASQQAAQAFETASRATITAQGGQDNAAFGGGQGHMDPQFGAVVGTPGSFVSTIHRTVAPPSSDQMINLSLGYGGLDAAIATAGQYEDLGSIKNLYDLKNAQTTDVGSQASNLRAEIALLNTLPETIARDQQIVTLTQSINQLTTATNASTAATAATLNPLYTQGAGALAIGYYHAATGLDGIVGGSGGTDSQAFHAMLTPGERVTVTPPGQSSPQQSGSAGQPVVNNVFNIGTGTTNNARRNARQVAQGYAQSIAAASR